MDYFFRCQKSNFSFENNKAHVQEIFLAYRDVTGSTYSKIILGAIYIPRIYTKFWKVFEKFNLYQI